MPSIPVFLTGPGAGFACTLTPQTVASNGALTNTTPVATLTLQLDSVEVSGSKTIDNISPLDSNQVNEVPIEVGTNITLSEILKKNGTNLLAQAYYGSSDYFLVSLTRGAQTFAFYGLAKAYNEATRKGKSLGSMTLGMVNVGTANPSYT